MSFNLVDYMDDRQKQNLGIEIETASSSDAPKLIPGRDFMKYKTHNGELEVFQFYFKGRFATFFEVGRRATTRDGKPGELLTLNRGKTSAIYYEAFRELGGELFFLGESKTQVVDDSMRTLAARRANKFN